MRVVKLVLLLMTCMTTHPGPTPFLAPEITDRIIDFLYEDVAALQACSLVCREWLPSSHYHLFSSISIYGSNEERERRTKKFMKIVPMIGPYVCSLEAFDYGSISSAAAYLVNLSHIAVHNIDRVQLVNLLSTCSSLKSLEFQYSHLTGFTNASPAAHSEMDAFANKIGVLDLLKIRSGLTEFLQWATSTHLLAQMHTIGCLATLEPPSTFNLYIFPLMHQIGGNMVHVRFHGLKLECTDGKVR